MTDTFGIDPFEELRIPVGPVDPDPAFVARLRRQLQDALINPIPPGGTEMAGELHETDTYTVTEHSDDGAWPPALTPYIAVDGARRAIDWYIDVFDARLRGGMYEGPDGTIGHAELALGDAVLMISDPWPEGGVTPPEPGQTHSHTLHLQVDDVDDTVRRAADAGATIVRQPEDQPYGRVATLVDPFGHRWMLNRPPASASRVEHGDIAYVTLSTPDDERARAFYGAVLGWQFTPGRVERGWNIEGRRPMMGLAGGSGAPDVTLVYRVPDITAAVERVRAAGGEAGEPQQQPYGLLADCRDDQGARFQLLQF